MYNCFLTINIFAVGLVAVPVVELVGWQLSSAIGITITIIGLVSAYFVTSFSYLFASFGICTGSFSKPKYVFCLNVF